MKVIHLTDKERALAGTYLDWFPSFCISSAYGASMDWPEKAWTVAQDIHNANEDRIAVSNERADAWVTARKQLMALRKP
jgi:hypothetical protein